MKLQYLSTLPPQQEGSNKIRSLACAPNSSKLAVVERDRIITLLDEKDHILSNGSAFLQTQATARLAVAQSDNVVYVYSIGKTWQVCSYFFL
ncbi:unnamed protein product [Cylicostephanus goldi]|uniref:Uncharacterized protein n=1 Tax=Cylicostephanus goldi TaxID=71465 RepID=A0A3P7NGE9_CYLGO|nr:unnamed protein product [Cylicostephanus goldi]